MDIAASGAGRCNLGCLHRCTLVPAAEYLFGFLLLTSTLYFQLGSGSGLDVIKYPHLQQYLFVGCYYYATSNTQYIIYITLFDKLLSDE